MRSYAVCVCRAGDFSPNTSSYCIVVVAKLVNVNLTKLFKRENSSKIPKIESLDLVSIIRNTR